MLWYTKNFLIFFKKIEIKIFGGISKFLELILGRFWQFWASFMAMAATTCPNLAEIFKTS
jgi:hypothetical protein